MSILSKPALPKTFSAVEKTFVALHSLCFGKENVQCFSISKFSTPKKLYWAESSINNFVHDKHKISGQEFMNLINVMQNIISSFKKYTSPLKKCGETIILTYNKNSKQQHIEYICMSAMTKTERKTLDSTLNDLK
ncbi:MAG: hypothetical protein ABL927_03645 [Bdellovibrionales bacterium]